MLRVFTMIAAVACATSVNSQEIMDDTAKNIPPEIMEEMVKAFGDRLVDPSSVQFRNLAMTRLAPSDYDSVCGDFNAKNGFGGYTGFERFQFHPPHRSLSFSQTAC